MEMRLVERKTAFLEQTDPFCVLIDASHMVPNGGEANTGDQTHVAAADDCNPQCALLQGGYGILSPFCTGQLPSAGSGKSPLRTTVAHDSINQGDLGRELVRVKSMEKSQNKMQAQGQE